MQNATLNIFYGVLSPRLIQCTQHGLKRTNCIISQQIHNMNAPGGMLILSRGQTSSWLQPVAKKHSQLAPRFLTWYFWGKLVTGPVSSDTRLSSSSHYLVRAWENFREGKRYRCSLPWSSTAFLWAYSMPIWLSRWVTRLCSCLYKKGKYPVIRAAT